LGGGVKRSHPKGRAVANLFGGRRSPDPTVYFLINLNGWGLLHP